jgi:signal transduction histidine kinase
MSPSKEHLSELISIKREISTLYKSEPTLSIELCNRYRELAIRYKSPVNISESYYYLGMCYNALGNNKEAINCYLQSFDNNISKDEDLNYKINISMGVSYRQIGEYTKSIQSYTRALNSKITERTDVIYNNMAVIYYHMNELDQAIVFSNKAFELYIKNGDIINSLGILNNVGKILTIQRKFNEAENQILRAKKIAIDNNITDQIIVAELYLGNLFFDKKDFRQAYKSLISAYELAVSKQKKNQLYSITLLLAKVCNKLGKFDIVNHYYKEALILSQEISVTELINCLNEYYIFLEEQKDYERAFHYLKQLFTISNDISLEEKTKELNKARLEFENKEQELKLEKLNAVKVLYDQLAEQSLELDKKNRKLENINNDLMHFSYALSHDLREPARLVKSYSDVLTFMLKDKLNEKETEMFAHLKNGAEKMEILIEDLHRYAVLGVNENMKKEVDLNKIIEGVLMILQLPIQESNATIEFDQLPTINTYPTLISQLFQNLISNALKYRKKDNIPMIKVKYAKIDNNHEIRIIDNGIGIPISEQPRIFRLFKRATNHKYEGTGVGLAFCQKIMDKINGNIQVYSRGENLGSEFITTIPIT